MAEDQTTPTTFPGATLEPWMSRIFAWTPELVRTAEVMADQGYLSLAADLCETLMTDDRIGGVLETRGSALVGLPMVFEGRSKRAVKDIEAREDWWVMAPESTIKLMQAWALMLGFCLMERVWVHRDGREVPTLVVKSAKYLRRDMRTRKWMLRIATPSGGTEEIEIEINTPGSRWVMYCPSGNYDRPWVRGLFHANALGKWNAIKLQAIILWGWATERWGLGILQLVAAMGEKTPLFPKEHGPEFIRTLKRLGPNGVFIPPFGHEVKVTESQARNWESFERSVERADNAYAVTVIGGNLTTQATSGTGKSADTQEGVALSRTRSDNETTSTFLHDHLTVPWAVVNYGSASYAPWASWKVPQPKDDNSARIASIAPAVIALRKDRIITRAEGRRMIGEGLEKDMPAELLEPEPDPEANKLYQYHLEYGVFTLNEIRKAKGLPPVDGGDKPPTPLSILSTLKSAGVGMAPTLDRFQLAEQPKDEVQPVAVDPVDVAVKLADAGANVDLDTVASKAGVPVKATPIEQEPAPPAPPPAMPAEEMPHVPSDGEPQPTADPAT